MKMPVTTTNIKNRTLPPSQEAPICAPFPSHLIPSFFLPKVNTILSL